MKWFLSKRTRRGNTRESGRRASASSDGTNVGEGDGKGEAEEEEEEAGEDCGNGERVAAFAGRGDGKPDTEQNIVPEHTSK